MYFWLMQALPWVLSAAQIWSSWLAADKTLLTQQVKIVGQFLWTVLVYTHLDTMAGLIPLNAVMWFLTIRTYVKWKADDDRDSRCREAGAGLGPGERIYCLEVDIEGQQWLAGYDVPTALPDGSIHRVQISREKAEAFTDDSPR